MKFKTYLSYTSSEEEKIKDLPSVARYKSIIKRHASQKFIDQLRIERHTHWLNATYATFFNTYETEKIVQYWSQQTKLIIQKAWTHTQLDHEPLACFAVGKLGANELNLSSDVDLFFISKELADLNLFKKIRKFIAILSSVEPTGFCYRVDTEIKPGGKNGPLVSTINQFQDYYWSHGATWERMALIRLQGIAGEQLLIDKLLKYSHKYTYRKYLDFRLSDRLKETRSKIHRQYFKKENIINLKMDPGGIRDIELFIHSLQVTHGGKIPELQTPSTSEALTKISKFNLLPEEEILILMQSYWSLRHLENLSQCYDDQQTYLWTWSNQQLIHSTTMTEKQLTSLFKETDKVVSKSLNRISGLAFVPDDYDEQISWLTELGFTEHTINELWPNISNEMTLKNDSNEESQLKSQLIHLLVSTIARSKFDKNIALMSFYQFLKATRARSHFYSLLLRKQDLLKNLTLLFSVSPHIGQILSSRPGLLDSFLLNESIDLSLNINTLHQEASEKKLLAEMKSIFQFINYSNTHQLNSTLSYVADRICIQILNALKQDYQITSNMSILALGKWGGEEIGIKSDLDFILVCKNAPTKEDFKLAKRFVQYLTSTNILGPLYNIDLRLRPSGQSGPLLVSEETLLNYLKTAAGWVRQSYLKSRWVNEILFTINKTLLNGLNQDDLIELKTIRQKLLKPTGQQKINIKLAAGGLIDTELCIQTLILYNNLASQASPNIQFMIQLLNDLYPENIDSMTILSQNYLRLRQLEQAYQIISTHSGATIDTQSDYFLQAALLFNKEADHLKSELIEILSQSKLIIKQIDPCMQIS